MSRRRGRTHQAPQCRDCRATVKWIRLAGTSSWRTFNPRTDPLHLHGSMPVWGNQAWDAVALAGELSVQRGCGPTEAAAEVLDLPWHQRHACEHFTPADDDDREGHLV